MDKILRFFGLIKISDIECSISAIERSIDRCKLDYLNGNISESEMNDTIKDRQMVGYKLIENRIGNNAKAN
jgi:hypothetical protein